MDFPIENGDFPFIEDIDFLWYPLVNVYKKLWKDPPCYEWENDHYFDWAIFNSYVNVYQSVSEKVNIL